MKDLIDVTKELMQEYYVNHNPQKMIQILSPQIDTLSISNNQNNFDYSEICRYLNYACHLHGKVKLENELYRIVKETSESVIIEAAFDVVGLYQIKRFHLTIVYELTDEGYKIVYMHNSYPYKTNFSSFNMKDKIQTLFAETNVPGICCYLDEEFTYSYLNEAYCLMFGYEKEEFIETYQNKAIYSVYPADRERIQTEIRNYLKVGNIYNVEYRVMKKDHSLIWVMEHGQSFLDEYGNKMIYAYVSDITSLKINEMNQKIQKEKYSLALKDNSITIMEYDIKLDRMIIDIQIESKKKIYENYLDYVRSPRTTVFDEDKEKVCDLFLRKIKGPIEIREHIRGEEKYVRKSMDSRIIYDENNEPIIVLATVKDITTEYNHNAIMQKRIQTDSLTHQLNFESGKKKIEEYLRTNQTCALMVLDIDYFKTVNDNYGHLIGNDVLVAFSNCLSQVLGDNHIIIRIGGDEFMILLKDVLKDEAVSLAEKLVRAVRELKFVDDKLSITTSIGISLLNDKDRDVDFELLFKNADSLLYTAKKNGRNRYELSDDLDYYINQVFHDSVSYEELNKQIKDDQLSLKDKVELLGNYFHFNRISLFELNENKEYTYKDVWVSSRAYYNEEVKGVLNSKDELRLLEKGKTFVYDYSFSDEFNDMIKQGVAKSIVIVRIEKGFVAFVNYDNANKLNIEESHRLEELMDVLSM